MEMESMIFPHPLSLRSCTQPWKPYPHCGGHRGPGELGSSPQSLEGTLSQGNERSRGELGSMGSPISTSQGLAASLAHYEFQLCWQHELVSKWMDEWVWERSQHRSDGGKTCQSCWCGTLTWVWEVLDTSRCAALRFVGLHHQDLT